MTGPERLCRCLAITIRADLAYSHHSFGGEGFMI
jgi:hypothetical protein